MPVARLNAEQLQVVHASPGPLCVIAGPGTGKTKTLVARLQYLIQECSEAPAGILALTFTNKAAREMQSRYAATQGPAQGRPLITTFHGLAHSLLPLAHEKMLINSLDRDAIITQLRKEKILKGASARDIGLAISRFKNQTDPPDDQALRMLVERYDTELATRNAYDYDDLLRTLHAALLDNEQQKQTARFRHILVDEFQDTNALQYAVLQLLQVKNTMVIGDPLQSIYGFRGAYGEVFERFRADHPDVRTITLRTNYRSTPQVVRLTNAIFPEAPQLHAHRKSGDPIQVIATLHEFGEAEWIVQEIERHIGGSTLLQGSTHHTAKDQRGLGDFAVLYRTHAIARHVIQRLEQSGLPYQVAGEDSPLARPPIATIIQALRYVSKAVDTPLLPGYDAAQAKVLLDPLFDELADTSVPQVIERTIAVLALETEKTKVALRQFVGTAVRFENTSLEVYVRHLQAVAEQAYYDPAAEAVTLLTIHASKGLEFPCVFMLAVEEGSLPYYAEGKSSDIAEEKRLFYVATTRARDALYMLHTHTRQRQPKELSSFVRALPQNIVGLQTDPAIARQLKTIRRREQKRSQSTLF